MPYLQVLTGPAAGRRYSLIDEGLVLGRDPVPGCDIALLSTRVSGRHATVLRDQGRWLLRDLGSMNGTYLDEERVQDDRELHPGAHIRLGDVELEVQGDAVPVQIRPVSKPPTPAPTPPAPKPPAPAPVQEAAVSTIPPKTSEPRPPPRRADPPAAPAPPPTDLLVKLKQGSQILRQSGQSGVGLTVRLRGALDKLNHAVRDKDPNVAHLALSRMLDEQGDLDGLPDDLAVIFETFERSLDYFDQLLRDAEQARRWG